MTGPIIAAEDTGGVAWGALSLAIVLLALNGFFVAAEFALLASRRSRIEQLAAEGNRRAKSALAGIRELTLMLAGAQLGITMCSLGLGLVAEPAVAQIFEGWFGGVSFLSDTASHVVAFTIALSIVVFLHMVVGEMAPKSWAISHPEDSAMRLAMPFRAFVTVFKPVIWFMNGLANLVVRAVGVEPQDERAMAHSPSDLRLLLDESAGPGGLAATEHELLTRSLELSGLTASDAMTVRRDIIAVSADASAQAAADEAHRTGRSRIIVFEGDLDHVQGFIHAKDLLRLPNGTWASTVVGTITRNVMVTPEQHRLEDLLLEMQTERQHIALVIDEHGTVVGVVTLEDVIEELIGDFDDESDSRHGACERLADGSFRINGTLRHDEFEEYTGVALPDGDWQTVAGFVIAALDEIPAVGDRVETEIGWFEVVSMDAYAIDALRYRHVANA
ncbi:hemolysin family protein [Ilumatobacter nonamiensis]|uniref:hemolysin family protein n=1 Tax=Ilumatobacter nonamiensis TaxID=467093 RepID=UPI00034A5E69|nr:hemolysin family protein [Ilumatobacter nonamiensis]